MIPAILAALGRVAGAAMAGEGAATGAATKVLSRSQLVYQAAQYGPRGGFTPAQIVNQRLPPPLPNQMPPPLPKQGMMAQLQNSVMGGSFLGNVAAQGLSAIVGRVRETFHKVTHPLETFREQIDKLHKSLVAVPDTVLHVKDAIVGTARSWVDALAAPIDTVKELGDVIGRFTQFSNPGGMKLLEFRINNAMATLGNLLQPVLNALTSSAEKMGDMFARLKPSLIPAAVALARLIDTITELVSITADYAAPALQSFTMSMLMLVEAIRFALGPLESFMLLMTKLGRWTGFHPSDPRAKSDFAVLPPSIKSAESIFNELAINALMSSMGPDQKKDVPDLLEDVIQAIEDLPDAIASAIAGAIQNPEIAAASAAATGTLGIAGAGINWIGKRVGLWD